MLFFFTTTVRCVLPIFGEQNSKYKQQAKRVSPKDLFSNTEQGGAKSNRTKKGTKSQEKSIYTMSNKIPKKRQKNKHLTYLHLVTESKQRLDGKVINNIIIIRIITKCRLDSLSTFSLWLCSSFRVVLLHVSTPESLTCGSHHAKSSSNECPPKRTIFFCLSDKVFVGSDINVCSIVFLFPL